MNAWWVKAFIGATLLCICHFTLLADSGLEKLWTRVAKHQKQEKFSKAQEVLKRIIKKYPNDPRTAKAKEMVKPTAYLGVLPYIDRGNRTNRINMVITGDGYDVNSQKRFKKSATSIVKFFFQEEPLRTYQNFFNVDFLYMASKDEGVSDNEKTYDTAWKCETRPGGGQVIAPFQSSHSLISQWVPDWGTLLILAYRGKLGVGYFGANICSAGPNVQVTAYHEFGHSFGALYDEYGSQPYMQKVIDYDSDGNEIGWHTEPRPNPTKYSGEPLHGPNITTNSNKEKAPWKHWYELKKSGVDFHEGGAGHDKGAWKPTGNCLMMFVSQAGAFCPVCLEHFILLIHEKVKMIDQHEPSIEKTIEMTLEDKNSFVVKGPGPNKKSFQTTWKLNGQEIRGGKSKVNHKAGLATYQFQLKGKALSEGANKLEFFVKDKTPHVLKDKKGVLEESLSWKINLTSS